MNSGRKWEIEEERGSRKRIEGKRGRTEARKVQGKWEVCHIHSRVKGHMCLVTDR